MRYPFKIRQFSIIREEWYTLLKVHLNEASSASHSSRLDIRSLVSNDVIMVIHKLLLFHATITSRQLTGEYFSFPRAHIRVKENEHFKMSMNCLDPLPVHYILRYANHYTFEYWYPGFIAHEEANITNLDFCREVYKSSHSISKSVQFFEFNL